MPVFNPEQVSGGVKEARTAGILSSASPLDVVSTEPAGCPLLIFVRTAARLRCPMESI